MVAIKAHQADQFLKAPDRRLSAFLFYGPDAGMVAERARVLAQAIAARESPPGEMIRLDDSDLEDGTERLMVELQTLPMFGGRKVIRTSASRRVTAALLKPVLAAGDLAATLVVEAGNLKADDALRKLFEGTATAAAVACYGDEEKGLETVVREVLAAARTDIAPEAREMLIDRLGADRVLSRNEIEKLALYAHGKPRIEAEDVEAIVGDASELTIDRILEAALSGDAATAVGELDRAVAAGESPQLVISSLLRSLHRLHRVRAAMDQGRSAEDVLRALRPPVHFKQKDMLLRHCRQWSLPALDRALSISSEAAKAARLGGSLETVLAERLLLDMAGLARRGAVSGRR